MSKRAELRRKAREESRQAIYTFTAAQLEERDRAQRKAMFQLAKKTIEQEMIRQKQDMLEDAKKQFKNFRDEFITEDDAENFVTMFLYATSMACRVLIEHFRWKPVREDRRMTRTEKFADLMVDELGKLAEDNGMSIYEYVEETYDLYGVKFKRE